MTISEERNAFATDFEDTLDDYRPLNAVAAGALVVSLASFLALTDLFFLFVPILAIGLSTLGFVIFATSRRKLSGVWMCTAAMCIGLFVTSWLVGFQIMRAYAIQSEARSKGMEWLGYIQREDIYEAHQLTLRYVKRELPGTNLRNHYMIVEYRADISNESERQMFEETTPRTAIRKFREKEPMKTIIEHAPDATFEFLREEKHERIKMKEDMVIQVYRMRYEQDGEPATLEFRLIIIREDMGRHFNAHWYIQHVAAADVPLENLHL